jgi:pimeloyl-ACP methyl ester carboxylesterase
MAKTIVFVHGMFMTPLCWEHWLPWFEAKGYRCLAPAWPGRDRPAADLRAANPDAKLGRLTLGEVVDRFAGEVAALQEKPILIGHAMGGLVTQILVSRDVAAAGIAIHSAPPPGVFTLRWSYLRSNWGMVGPFADMRTPKTLTFEEFQKGFANTLPLEAQTSAFQRYIVPDSRAVARDSRGEFARIDFDRPHRPLLLTAGVQDRFIPARLNFNNYSRYRQRGAITDFRAFDGKDHCVIVEPGWQEVADFVAQWLGKL